MFTIDLIVKDTPMPLSVDRKESEDADKLYKKITDALSGATPQLLELTCDKQPEKKVAVFSDRICAVVVSQKSGPSTSRVAGFFAATNEK